LAFPFYIAKRYLFSKKSHTAINIISGVSVCGVAIATAALVCILSVFNGFQDMVAGLFTAVDPELKVVPVEGKYVAADDELLETLRKNRNIAVYTEVVEDNALLIANNRQVMVTIKGVDDNFEDLTDINNILYGDGIFELHADVLDYGVAGIGVLQQLGLPVDFMQPIQVYAPRGDERIDMTDPSESFNIEELYSPNVGFMVKQNKYDGKYVLTNINFARRLFEKEGMVTAVELKLKKGVNIASMKSWQQVSGAGQIRAAGEHIPDNEDREADFLHLPDLYPDGCLFQHNRFALYADYRQERGCRDNAEYRC